MKVSGNRLSPDDPDPPSYYPFSDRRRRQPGTLCLHGVRGRHRPTFALERLELIDAECAVYRLHACSDSGQRDGTPVLTLTPLELIDHLAALIPPPRRHRHRHRYHSALAPNSRVRAAATAYRRKTADDPGAPAEVISPRSAPASNTRAPARYLWAMLLARLFKSLR
jgi:hypothetical protein